MARDGNADVGFPKNGDDNAPMYSSKLTVLRMLNASMRPSKFLFAARKRLASETSTVWYESPLAVLRPPGRASFCVVPYRSSPQNTVYGRLLRNNPNAESDTPRMIGRESGTCQVNPSERLCTTSLSPRPVSAARFRLSSGSLSFTTSFALSLAWAKVYEPTA